MVNQQPSHLPRGDVQQVLPVLPVNVVFAEQPQVNFVNQRRGLQ